MHKNPRSWEIYPVFSPQEPPTGRRWARDEVITLKGWSGTERVWQMFSEGWRRQECWSGTYKSKDKGNWKEVWRSWGETPWPWITTAQNQTHRGVISGEVIKWPPSASTSPCWWAQGYIVMSKPPKMLLAGVVPNWPIRLKGVAPHCPERV